MRPVDPDLLKEYALNVWQYKQGEMVSLMIYLGDRLGLYEAMADGVAMTSEQLASTVGLDERLVREWLLGQAAAGLIDRYPDQTFSLSPEGEAVLVNDENLAFAAGAFIGGVHPQQVENIINNFQTGRGVSYSQQGEEVARKIDRMNGPWLRVFLPEMVLPGLDGVMDKLERGAVAADVGCGGAVSVEILARRFPASRFTGYEPSEPGAELARRRLASLPNAQIVQSPGEELPDQPTFDFVMTLDCLHDMPFPQRVATAIRRAIKPDGTWLIKDMRCSDDFEKNMKNPVLAMQYGFSVSGCLLAGTAQEGGAALGTLGLTPKVAESMVRQAGFTRFQKLSWDQDPVHFYYEVRL